MEFVQNGLYKFLDKIAVNKWIHENYLPISVVTFHFSVLFLMDLPMVKLIKLAKMAGVMHEADHAYSIWSTW